MFEDELHGTPGRDVYEVDRNQRVIRRRDELSRAPVAGNNVKLTIDIDVQKHVEDELVRVCRLRARPSPSRRRIPAIPTRPSRKHRPDRPYCSTR